jgi:hypothetical protein
MNESRRGFLQTAAGLAVASQLHGDSAVSAPLLPTMKFAGREITKLIIGSNPFYGYSHSVPLLDKFMREWMTPDRRQETLKRAEQCGINTWQVHYNDPTVEDWKRYRAEGGKMNVLLLADFAMTKDWTLIPKVAKELKPIGIAHHGNRTDERFRAGQMNVVRDFVQAVHDAGLPAGVSTHNPHVVSYIENQGWDNDYYMTCLYRVSRDTAETRAQLGEAPLGEVFMEKDPERMTDMIRKTRKTCFAFKLLGAGRGTGKPEAVEQAFRYALTRVKAQDAVIVGMCPKFKDEVKENADLVRRICGEVS